ncbi:glutamate synthase [Vulcanisaeta souniana]|uniref:Glutamate synthase n=1 Tax=Vulcanisaeta souniana JCM 11219 TaxID=1293586 RepID=A0A830EHD6_9CREN|nr:glutamate synthase [Vulcanisaeta souniana]BDR92531.1 glutamate synthase [Vulcanisaeta souniana JCM 11219]GGI83109.1 glutamate synthase [Vulcanisaeta souniana JCM 11219]
MSIFVKYPADCGIFGVIRRSGADRVSGNLVVRAMETIRFRGAGLGSGFALLNNESMGLRVGVFVKEGFMKEAMDTMESLLKGQGIDTVDFRVRGRLGPVNDLEVRIFDHGGLGPGINDIINKLNDLLWEGKSGRIYYWGEHINVFKGVGYPSDIASVYNVERHYADLWIAHTRFPTNSPGYLPYWSHPFSVGDIAVVHNGELSSYGSHVNALLYGQGLSSFVGTDSEVAAYIMYYLVRNYGLNIEDAVKMLIGQPLKYVDDVRTRSLIRRFRWAVLDGPFAMIMGLYHNDDLYLVAMTDRFKLRPIVIGMDEDNYYVASEEIAIRAVSPDARVWTLEPGGYFIVSLKRGVVSWGRARDDIDLFFARRDFPKYVGRDAINAEGLGYKELNEEILRRILSGERVVRVINVNGQRYIGVNLPRHGIRDARVEIYGTPGNSLANLNNGVEFVIYGNAQDDVADTMHDGKIVIHGDARDVLGQALQGGEVFVRGNAGNRVGIQMREYRSKRPYLIIGGKVDDYLGEYMAGGVIMVLGIDALSKCNVQLVGKHVGNGMVGGRIYIRSKVLENRVGLTVPHVELRDFLEAATDEGLGQDEANRLLDIMMHSEHVRKNRIEYRELTEDEIRELGLVLHKFAVEFNIDETTINNLLNYKYSIITAD